MAAHGSAVPAGPDPVRGTQGLLNAPAWLAFQINDEKEVTRLPLTEIPESEASGPYNVQRAAFAKPEFMRKLFKDGNGVRKIDTVLPEVGAGLVGIPLERH